MTATEYQTISNHVISATPAHRAILWRNMASWLASTEDIFDYKTKMCVNSLFLIVLDHFSKFIVCPWKKLKIFLQEAHILLLILMIVAYVFTTTRFKIPHSVHYIPIFFINMGTFIDIGLFGLGHIDPTSPVQVVGLMALSLLNK